jgi:hypothetical protein
MKKILIKTVRLGFCLLLCGTAILLSACGEKTDAEPAARPTAPAPSVSEKLSEEIKANWASWDAKSKLQQALSSTMPGSESMYFWTWDNAVAYLGYSPWNPLEEAGFLEKMNTAGTPILPLGGDTLEHAVLRFQGDRDGSLTQISLQAGYSTADGTVRVILTAELIRGTACSEEAGRQIPLKGSITGKETRDENDNYQAVNLYFDRENVFYTIRLIAGKSSTENAALEETYALILALIRIRLGGISTEEGQMQTADPKENGVPENWDTLGLSESPEAVLETLMSENVVIQKDSGLLSGRGLWEEFFEKTQNGEPASVLLVHYYTENNVRMAFEYFETEYPKYPQCFLGRLDFDGTLYHYVVRKSDKAEIESGDDVTFRYLKCFTGEMPAQAVYDSFQRYVLVNDESLTWDRLERSLFSSYSGDSVGFRMVVSEYFTESGDFPAAYVPDEEELSCWYPQYGVSTPGRRYMRAALSGSAREIFPETAPETQSLLALAEGDEILWRRELPYDLGNMISMEGGVLASGCVIGEDYSSGRVYVERWDGAGNRLWQWTAENPEQYDWILLAAEETNGVVRCLFLVHQWRSGIGFAKVLVIGEKGELREERQAEIGSHTVYAAAFHGDDAILALSAWQGKDGYALVRMDRAGNLSEAVRLPRAEEEWMTIESLTVRNGTLYVSLTYRLETYPDAGVREIMTETLDIPYGEIRPSEELTRLVRKRYRAELRAAVLPESGLPSAEQFRVVYGRKGVLGDRLSVDETGTLCWDIREPEGLYAAPWADSFSIGGTCRIYRLGFAGDVPEWIMPTDRKTFFREL